MNEKLQHRIQRYGWDKAATRYEDLWREQLSPAHDQLFAMAAAREGEQVLDIATGSGLMAFRMADEVGSAGHVLGTDISGEMVELAVETARSRGVSNVRFERMEAERLAVDHSSFDLVICALGLMYSPNSATALAEASRVLKPGGRFVAAVWGARENCGWASIFPIVDARVRSEVCPLFYRLGTGNALACELEDAGFSDVQSSRLNTTLRYESGEEACDASFIGGPVALAYSRFDAPTRSSVRGEFLESIEDFRTGRGYDVPGEFVVTRGIKE